MKKRIRNKRNKYERVFFSFVSFISFVSYSLFFSFAQTHQHENHSDHAGHNTSSMMTTVTGGPFRSMFALGSGTALQPASTPMSAWHFMPGDWMLMIHAEIKAGFNYQAKPRGVGKAESQNWLMVMAERDVWRGRLMLRGMVSAEPLTAPRPGFPQLFQTGETYRNWPIIDAQHAHDLFMELAASYTIPISERISFQVYGGPVAEPALGPVAFMHRASAMENPAAPLSHHFQDSTHISHGVVTGAITAGKFKIEASRFNGREPDEDRVGIDMGSLDSYSFRAWFTPTANWAAQFSYGRLNNPEAIHAGPLIRKTASITYNLPISKNSNWSSAIIWGRNDETHGDENSYLFESTLQLKDKNHFYTRLELADKKGLLIRNSFGRPGLPTDPLLQSMSGEIPQNQLLCCANPFHRRGAESAESARRKTSAQPLRSLRLGGERNNVKLHPDPNFVDFEIYNKALRVGAFTFGGVRDFVSNDKIRIGIGGDVTFYHVPSLPRFPLLVNQIYGERPVSFHIFFRFRPGNLKL